LDVEAALGSFSRRHKNAPGCFGGVENHDPLAGCYRLDAAVEDWGARNKDFLAEPSEDWWLRAERTCSRVAQIVQVAAPHRFTAAASGVSLD
jgi:hypothetical protein